MDNRRNCYEIAYLDDDNMKHLNFTNNKRDIIFIKERFTILSVKYA